MQKLMLLAVVFLSPGVLVQAQSNTGARDATDEMLSNQYKQRLEAETFLRYSNGDSGSRRAEERAAEYRREIFYTKAKKFVNLWTDFAAELNDRKTFNAKLAKEVSKAFHDLESSEGWPVPPAKAAH